MKLMEHLLELKCHSNRIVRYSTTIQPLNIELTNDLTLTHEPFTTHRQVIDFKNPTFVKNKLKTTNAFCTLQHV